MIVKVPLSSGGGDLYFTKSDQLEVQFIRRVNLDDNKNQFSGYDEFINMNNYRYLKINYSEGKEISRIGSNSSKNNKGSNQIRSNNYFEGSWFGAMLYCIGEYIIAIPRRYGNGWKCYGPGNDEEQGTQDYITADAGGSGQFNWAAWYLFYQPTYNNIIGPSDPWLPYYGGYYDPSNQPTYIPPPGGLNPNYPGLIQGVQGLPGFRLIEGIGLVPELENWNNWNQDRPFDVDGIPLLEPEDASVIDLGYEILNIESDPPPDGNYPRRKIGSTNDRSNAEERNHGTNSDDSFVKRLDGAPSFRSNSNLSDNELISYLKVTKNIFSFWGLNNVASEMLNKFSSKSGGEFRNSQLNEAVKNSQEFKNFAQRFTNLFNSKLRDAGGDINNVTSFDIDQQYRPKFTWKKNIFNGLTFLLNDTAETSVEINNFTLVNGKWTATFIITIKDWFGVDSNDVTTYQNGFFGNGFAAWWLLQHKRGYPPVQTIVSLGVTLTGNM